jgi:hypothetical protein
MKGFWARRITLSSSSLLTFLLIFIRCVTLRTFELRLQNIVMPFAIPLTFHRLTKRYRLSHSVRIPDPNKTAKQCRRRPHDADLKPTTRRTREHR